MVRSSSQQWAFEYARSPAAGEVAYEFDRNPEANLEHLVEELGIDPRFRADVLADLRWGNQTFQMLDGEESE